MHLLGEHENLWGLSLQGDFGPTKRSPPPSFSAACRVPPHNSSCSRTPVMWLVSALTEVMYLPRIKFLNEINAVAKFFREKLH